MTGALVSKRETTAGNGWLEPAQPWLLELRHLKQEPLRSLWSITISVHFGGNHLNADLTGDGQPDLTITGAAAFHSIRMLCSSCSSFTLAVAQAHLNGVLAYARLDGDNIEAFVILGSQFRSIGIGRTPGSVYFGSSLTGSIPISFKDLHINGGALTQGSLEVTVSTAFLGDPKIQLDSFT